MDVVISLPCKAFIYLGVFGFSLASSLTTEVYQGEVFEYDVDSKYCRWRNKEGREMPVVNINCIGFCP
jgi:hypothetical protein